MFHNAVVYGLIGTVNSFSFLARSTGGRLKITRLIPATRTNPTALQMLCYFSNLCASTSPLRETHIDGRACRTGFIHSLTRSSSFRPKHAEISRSELRITKTFTTFQTKDRDVVLDIDVTRKNTSIGWNEYIGFLETGEKFS